MATSASSAAGYGSLPLYFVENRGQVDRRVGFYAHARGATSYFTGEGVTFAIGGGVAPEGTSTAGEVPPRYTVKLDFLGANPEARLAAGAPTEATFSYFKGRPDQWITGVPTYAGAVYQELWPGIDLAYGSDAGHLKYELRLQPGADPNRITFGYRGATSVTLNERGALDLRTPIGGLLDQPPYAYQDVDGRRVTVQAAFVVEEDEQVGQAVVGFELGAYDRSLPLVIDPAVFVYVGYIGGSNVNGFDEARAVAVDSDGNAYVGGNTSSTEATFPELVGPDLTFNGFVDAFVAKVRPNGSGLIYAGFVGGSQRDDVHDLAVDGSGAVYLTGRTFSTQSTFPVTSGAFDTTQNGNIDAFVAKVTPDGTSLAYATFVGGSQIDEANGIALEPGCQSACNAYVVGKTDSSHDAAVHNPPFPVTVGPDLTFSGGPIDNLFGPPSDGFVLKLNGAGSALVYCGYVGGGGNDIGMAVDVDAQGNAYLAGQTSSSHDAAVSNPPFPVTAGAFDTTFGGSNDAFVGKIRADGTGLAYLTYVGGSGSEGSGVKMGLAVDSANNAYLGTLTSSTNVFPPGTTGLDLSANGSTDGLILKLNAAGSALVWGTYFGGAQIDQVSDLAVDGSGNVYVTGRTTTSEAQGFPVTNGPDLTYNDTVSASDGFVALILASGTVLGYSTYLGGTSTDEGIAIAADESGNAYVVGTTFSSASEGFPVLTGPDTTFNDGSMDVFVAKIAPNATPPGPFNVNSTLDQTDASPVGRSCSTSLFGAGVCTLRAAIMEANRHPLAPITINVPAGSYTLTIPPHGTSGDDTESTALRGDLDIAPATNVTIVGAGASSTFIQACDAVANSRCVGIDRIFEIHAGATVTMSGVTVRNGQTTANGGAIFNRGTLSLANAIVAASHADLHGGGLANETGTVTLKNVTVANNSAPTAGGIENLNGTLTLTNVTISGNSADNTAGGLLNNGPDAPTIVMNNVTLANNSTDSNTGVGGIQGTSQGLVTLRNTILAHNTSASSAASHCILTGIASEGFTLVFPGTGATCGLTRFDVTGLDPKLGPLTNNGGSVPTHALLTGSGAIDRGNPATPLDGLAGRCPSTDARGFGRPTDGDNTGGPRCDIGAFEAGASQIGLFAVTPAEARAQVGDIVTLTFEWAVPEPKNWHNLASLDLRLVDDAGIGIQVHWLEVGSTVGNTFSVIDGTGSGRLDGLAATLLDTPRTQGSGPTGPSVALTIPLKLASKAEGRAFRIEVAAADDDGTGQAFQQAGVLTVGEVNRGIAGQPPEDSGDKRDKDERVRDRRPTEEQKQQHERTNTGNKDDVYTEGNVVEVHQDEQPPFVTIANRDGLVRINLLCGSQCPTIRVGDYLEADGTKQNEQELDAESVNLTRRT